MEGEKDRSKRGSEEVRGLFFGRALSDKVENGSHKRGVLIMRWLIKKKCKGWGRELEGSTWLRGGRGTPGKMVCLPTRRKTKGRPQILPTKEWNLPVERA